MTVIYKDRYCPNCNTKYKVATKETVKRLKFIPARFEVVEEVTYVYSCPKCGAMKRPEKAPSLLKGSAATPSLVGLYGSAVKIYNVIKNILSAIIVVLIPRFSVLLNTDGEKWKAEKLFSESANALTVLMLPMVVGLCMLAEDIIYLIAGESYLAGTTSLQILSVATFFSLYAYMFTHCILVPLKKENLVFKITLLSALTNIGLNFLFIRTLTK